MTEKSMPRAARGIYRISPGVKPRACGVEMTEGRLMQVNTIQEDFANLTLVIEWLTLSKG